MPNNVKMDDNFNEWKAITQNIMLMIEASGKSKTQIASEIGVAKSTLSQYLCGRAYPSLVTLKLLCKAIDCDYDDILGKI